VNSLVRSSLQAPSRSSLPSVDESAPAPPLVTFRQGYRPNYAVDDSSSSDEDTNAPKWRGSSKSKGKNKSVIPKADWKEKETKPPAAPKPKKDPDEIRAIQGRKISRPRGKASGGVEWDYMRGGWVKIDDITAEPGKYGYTKGQTTALQGNNSVSETARFNQIRKDYNPKFKRPLGRAKNGEEWDYERGKWVSTRAIYEDKEKYGYDSQVHHKTLEKIR